MENFKISDVHFGEGSWCEKRRMSCGLQGKSDTSTLTSGRKCVMQSVSSSCAGADCTPCTVLDKSMRGLICPDVDGCISLCNDDSHCMTWTFDSSKSQCFLSYADRNPATDAQDASGFTSGVSFRSTYHVDSNDDFVAEFKVKVYIPETSTWQSVETYFEDDAATNGRDQFTFHGGQARGE